MFSRPKLLLRVEGAFLLLLSLLVYRQTHASWLMFAALLLVPDVSLAGYVAGTRIGAPVYNLVHTLTGPLLLICYSVLSAHFSLLPYGFIWTAHIGMDRTLGFGLKYPTSFKDTHLQRV